jgi:hypothetical protein
MFKNTGLGYIVSITPTSVATPTGYATLQFVSGKLIAARVVAHTSPSPSGLPLIYLKDRRTHTSYLVDTGAAVSLLPYSSPLYPSGPKIFNASGKKFPLSKSKC